MNIGKAATITRMPSLMAARKAIFWFFFIFIFDGTVEGQAVVSLRTVWWKEEMTY